MTITLLGPLSSAVIDTVAGLASAITLLCVAPLVWLTWKGRAHPSPVTWGVWAAVGIVATIAMALGGAPFAAWLLKGSLSLGPVAVAAAALYKGEPWRTDRLDRICLALGVIGTVIYAVVLIGGGEAGATALIAVGTAMLVDAIGAGPTWARGWRNPRGELILTYALALASVVAVLAILPWPWTLLSAAYLVFLALQMASIIAVLAAGRRRESRPIGSEVSSYGP